MHIFTLQQAGLHRKCQLESRTHPAGNPFRQHDLGNVRLGLRRQKFRDCFCVTCCKPLIKGQQTGMQCAQRWDVRLPCEFAVDHRLQEAREHRVLCGSFGWNLHVWKLPCRRLTYFCRDVVARDSIAGDINGDTQVALRIDKQLGCDGADILGGNELDDLIRRSEKCHHALAQTKVRIQQEFHERRRSHNAERHATLTKVLLNVPLALVVAQADVRTRTDRGAVDQMLYVGTFRCIDHGNAEPYFILVSDSVVGIR